MTKKKQALNQTFYSAQSHNCFDCGRESFCFSLGASKFFNKPICYRCGDTDYRRSHDFKNPEDQSKSHKNTIPYDFMEQEQHEVSWLSGLVSDLTWLTRLARNNKTHLFDRWKGLK
jgi:hypothetical protein